jgi:hypothetical protein
VSRKSVPFSMPNGAPRTGQAGSRPSPEVIEANSDEWVSDRNSGTTGPARPGRSLLLDLAAERSLTEVIALGIIAPIALGCFWLLNAVRGRARL